MRQRASCLLLRCDSLLLVRRHNERGLYYVLPGGGIEAGETPERAVVREVLEEAGIRIKADQVLFASEDGQRHDTLILCHQEDQAEPIWQEHDKQTPENTYAFEWLPVTDLAFQMVLPNESRIFILEKYGKNSDES